MAETFLQKLAKTLLDAHGVAISELTIILPNKRAKVFLMEAFREYTRNNIFAPEIISIEEFIQDISGIRSIDNIELLFEFYEAYIGITPPEKQQPFELFANWAKTLLQDFNEIDRYLITPPEKVLKYLEEIKELEHWSVGEAKTELIENYLEFWRLLPTYYHTLYSQLLRKGIGYQGMVYREAIANLSHFSDYTDRPFIFAGFNALNAAEEEILQHLLALEKAKVYWDSDLTFLEDTHHDAGLFLRRFKKDWKHYKNNPFEWIADDFKHEKNINVIGTPKSIGQAKIAGKIVKDIIGTQSALSKTAIILAEENLLLPLLYSLPVETGALNITMGYSGKNNPAQVLIAKLFKMHLNSRSRNADSYVIYYKDVLDILTHPLVEPFLKAANLVQTINRNNYTFITHRRLQELFGHENDYFRLLFQKWDDNPAQVLENLSAILLTIKGKLSNDNQQEKITKAFVYAVFKVINKLTTQFTKHSVTNLDVLHTIYKQVIDLAEVSFEGEPLEGLQVMGVLESRVLDFDNVIVLSMNEGKFPAGKSTNSFIPYDVKRELGLPTFKEKDAIYTYHFYHLLQRAKNVHLLYNTESEGLDGGEKSRFITQLEVEKQQSHRLSHQIYQAEVPKQAYQPIVIPKSESVMARLWELAESGFSPSSLTAYIRNPLTFYFQRILRISETDEVEENIALNTLGTIIHGTLEALYMPFVGRFLTADDLRDAITKIDAEVLVQFKMVYREGEIKKGKNLLAFEVAKRHVLNFMKMELAEFENDNQLTIQILALEKRFERKLDHPNLPFPVRIGGSVDRIEIRNGKVRIVDYKTGKVEKRSIQLSQWQGLTTDIKNDKIIQVLAYAFMYEPEAKGRDIEVGIVSFKNMRSGFMPFVYIEDKQEITTITEPISKSYLNELVVLLNEILDPKIPFSEKID
jgi:hypothetical protein